MDERLGAPDRTAATLPPPGGRAPRWRRLVSAQFTGRPQRDLLFCAAEAVLGLGGIVVLVASLGLPLLVFAVTWSLLHSGRPHTHHPIRTYTDIALLASLLLAAFLVPRVARGLGAIHRRAAAALGAEWIAGPPRRRARGFLGDLGAAVSDSVGWKAAAYQLVSLPVTLAEWAAGLLALTGLVNLSYPLWWSAFQARYSHPATAIAITPAGVLRVGTLGGAFVVLGIGAAMLLAAPWLARAVAAVDRWLMRELLGPSPLAQRVVDLEEARGLAVDDSAALLRRLERDLHDGAQIRLVTLAMNLGMAREKLGEETDPAVRELVDAAHLGAKDALAELRSLARGIHPPVLDNGLADALATLATASAIPVELSTDIAVRPTPAIETIAYFCAAELLANAIKHSGASQILVSAAGHRSRLTLEISDDGRGGATAAGGSGLTGLAQRVRSVDGRVDIVSPAGGPTWVTVTLPMRT
jgi:signal transduction histidine kinase